MSHVGGHRLDWSYTEYYARSGRKIKRTGYQGRLAGKGVNKQKLAKQLAKRS